jgi:hypothetical protein
VVSKSPNIWERGIPWDVVCMIRLMAEADESLTPIAFTQHFGLKGVRVGDIINDATYLFPVHNSNTSPCRYLSPGQRHTITILQAKEWARQGDNYQRVREHLKAVQMIQKAQDAKLRRFRPPKKANQLRDEYGRFARKQP